MLRTHNKARRRFCALFLNIVRRGKGVETQNCLNLSLVVGVHKKEPLTTLTG